MKKVLIVVFLLITCFCNAQIVINEICPANADINIDDTFNFSGWIELYNNSNSAVDISGYYLSDENAVPSKWQIEIGTTINAKAYLIIWCDKRKTFRHTNFSLSSKGGDVVLSSMASLTLDKFTYPKQYANISYGRTSNGGTQLNYLSTPTPGSGNISGAAATSLDNVVFSLASGRYASTQSLSLSHPQANAIIRYTTDGSEPSMNSTAYDASISIDKTRTLKTKAFHADFLPSKTEVRTYFINEHIFTLPVVSLSTAPNFLWDNTMGIYTDGTNGIIGNCQDLPKNWNQDWDRHAYFEYYDQAGKKQFDQSLDIRIGGGCSRGNAQKSFAINPRDKYGKNTVDENLFKSKEINQFGAFNLNNSGNDCNVTMFRDALMHTLIIDQMNMDYLAYQPSILYVNGAYWGIQNLREKIDADYLKANYDIDSDDIDLLETQENALEGTNEAYQTYKTTLQSMDLSDPASFQYIDDHIDVQEFINYLTAEIYYGNTDWPGNNVKFWRQRSTNGKFRWILWDTDFGFGLYDWASTATHPTLDFATDPDNNVVWPNPPSSTLHIRLLLQNPIFRTRFIQTLSTAINTTYKPERVIKFIDDFQYTLKTEMPFHKQRWGGNIDDWNYQVQRLRDFATARNVFMQQHILDFFGLSESVNLSVDVSPLNSGDFKLNGIKSGDALVNGSYFKDLPFTVEAVPHAGYTFKNWKVIKKQAMSLVSKGDSWKYFDQGTLPNVNWPTTSYNDNTWTTGSAEFGYGEGDEQTSVSFGPDANNKFITTYFRKAFAVADIDELQTINASILFDDAALVYINGVEVYRNNITGVVTNNTLATAAATENVFNNFSIDKSYFVEGQNIIAVEIHQNGNTSSDISFDFEMAGVWLGSESETMINSPVLTDTADSDFILQAIYEPLPEVSGIIINEFVAGKSGVKDDYNEEEDWIELYNKGTEPVDLAGLFITDDLTNKTKHQIIGNAETMLAPGEYLVLWADGEIAEGPLHLNFKLSADGEDIGLYQVVGIDTLALDELTFSEQPDNVSSSRIPNITGPFVFTMQVTPTALNTLVTDVEKSKRLSLSLYPNPIGQYLSIKSESTLQQVSVYDVYGRAIKNISNVANGEPVFMGDLPSGFYIVKVRSVNQELVVKIMKE